MGIPPRLFTEIVGCWEINVRASEYRCVWRASASAISSCERSRSWGGTKPIRIRPVLGDPVPEKPGEVLTILTTFSGTESLTNVISFNIKRSMYSNVLPSGAVTLALIRLRSSYGAVSFLKWVQNQAIIPKQIARIGKLSHLTCIKRRREAAYPLVIFSKYGSVKL